jgi:hypothetical protein
VWPLELQTINVSEADGITSSTNKTGSLVDLIPFAVNNYANVLELYMEDWLLALDPNYAGLSGPNINPAYAAFASDYYNAIASASLTNINTINYNPEFTLYPLPASGIVNIDFNNSFAKLRIDVLNSLGQLILSKNISNQTSTTIDLSNCAKGMYFIKVQNGNGVVVRKVIISG